VQAVRQEEPFVSDSPAIEVVVVVGAGSIGRAIARRVGAGRTIVLADRNPDTAEAAANDLKIAGYATQTAQVDVAERASIDALVDTVVQLGSVVHVIHTAGLSPVQASPQAIVTVDLVGTAHVLEAFGAVIAPGGSGIVIASQAGHMLPPLPEDQNQALAATPAGQLVELAFLQPDVVANSGYAYGLSKRANILRVQAESTRWGDRGGRLNSLSPGIIMTPLAMDELSGPGAARYQKMIEASAAGRVGTPDEVAAAAAFLLGRDGAFITGTDLLIDGGVIAAIATGRYQLGMS
jgi:NAD(P)-dependent dehydrogenase (short-subunit alcohol dehydrogenase family)